MRPLQLSIKLPDWFAKSSDNHIRKVGQADEARMGLAVELAHQNIAEGTGGPFAAIVVEETSGACVAAGVNVVVTSGLSIAHAEAVAIMLAQRQAGTFNLAAVSDQKYTLYTTGQPCIMCFGILWWSGITKLVCAARSDDIESIAGFHEGPLGEDWQTLLAKRQHLPPIAVVHDVLREEACDVLRKYTESGHPIYNPGPADL